MRALEESGVAVEVPAKGPSACLEQGEKTLTRGLKLPTPGTVDVLPAAAADVLPSAIVADELSADTPTSMNADSGSVATDRALV